MNVNQEHVRALVDTIDDHDLWNKIGIHLVHWHDPIPRGKIKLEMKLETLPGKWIKPVAIDSLNLDNTRGVVFKFFPNQMCRVPYEFDEGPSPASKGDVDGNNYFECFYRLHHQE